MTISNIKETGLVIIDSNKYINEDYKKIEPLVIETVNQVWREQFS